MMVFFATAMDSTRALITTPAADARKLVRVLLWVAREHSRTVPTSAIIAQATPIHTPFQTETPQAQDRRYLISDFCFSPPHPAQPLSPVHTRALLGAQPPVAVRGIRRAGGVRHWACLHAAHPDAHGLVPGQEGPGVRPHHRRVSLRRSGSTNISRTLVKDTKIKETPQVEDTFYSAA